MNLQSHGNDYVTYELDNGILFVTFKPKIVITESVAREIIKCRLEFTNGKPYPGLVEGIRINSIDKSARAYMSSDEASEGVVATAFMNDSAFSAYVINFFLTVISSPAPTKVFTDRKKALLWLENYKS